MIKYRIYLQNLIRSVDEGNWNRINEKYKKCA